VFDGLQNHRVAWVLKLRLNLAYSNVLPNVLNYLVSTHLGRRNLQRKPFGSKRKKLHFRLLTAIVVADLISFDESCAFGVQTVQILLSAFVSKISTIKVENTALGRHYENLFYSD